MTQEKENKFIKNFGDLVRLFDNKPVAFSMVGLILVILYLWYKNDQLNARAVEREREFTAQIVAEVRRQVKPVAEDLQNKQDSTRVKVDSTRAELIPVIKSIKETVQKINNKK